MSILSHCHTVSLPLILFNSSSFYWKIEKRRRNIKRQNEIKTTRQTNNKSASIWTAFMRIHLLYDAYGWFPLIKPWFNDSSAILSDGHFEMIIEFLMIWSKTQTPRYLIRCCQVISRDYTNKKGVQLKYRNILEMTVLHTLTVYFDVCHPNWPCVRVRLSVWVWNIRLHVCAYLSKWMAEPQRHFYVRWGCVQWNNVAFSNLKQRKQKRNFEKPQTNNEFMGF